MGREGHPTRDTALLDEVMGAMELDSGDEGYDLARRGVRALLGEMLTPARAGALLDKNVVDGLIAEIDARLSAQLDVILHHPDFQQLEAAWRALKFVVDHVDFRENIRVAVLNASKDDLLADFEDCPAVHRSGLYNCVIGFEYTRFKVWPPGLIVGNYEFGRGPQDIALLTKIAMVAAVAHAPFIASAGPAMFGEKTWETLPSRKDLKSLFEGPEYARWHTFRENEDACYVGLCLPRLLLRRPYGEDLPWRRPCGENSVAVEAYQYEEDVSGHRERYLWGSAAAAFATRVADSFAKYRWCANIIGPQGGGVVEDVPVDPYEHEAMWPVPRQAPVEIQLTERREYELSEAGFIGLTYRKDSYNACFFSANSCQKPKTFEESPEGRAAETSYRLSTQLPYLFIITRLAHYLKVLQREQIGSWKEREDLERELNAWIGQYVADMDDPAPGVRSRRPLRKASIKVEDVAGQREWYRCELKVRPHFKYMGAPFTLSLVGKLDKE